MDTNIPSAEMMTAVGLGPVPPKPERLQSVDLVRGLVMILMALDHVRDFWSDRLLMDPTDLDRFCTTTTRRFERRIVSRHYKAGARHPRTRNLSTRSRVFGKRPAVKTFIRLQIRVSAAAAADDCDDTRLRTGECRVPKRRT
jgi:hypothetical protein